MKRQVVLGGWYGFNTLEGDWGSLVLNFHIQTSRGLIPLPEGENVLFLVGATRGPFLFMGGQGHRTGRCWLYSGSIWVPVGPLAWGVSPCSFSQDGKYFYFVTSNGTGSRIDMDTGLADPKDRQYFVDGIRAVIPPNNEIILGNTTKFDPVTNLFEYINFRNGLVVGQANAGGMAGNIDGANHIVETGGTFFIRAQYDGFNMALATVKQDENQTVFWWLNKDELKGFPVEGSSIPAINRPCWMGWFEFVNPVNPAPHNCMNEIFNVGRISDKNGNKFAQWIQGHSVEDIEAQCQSRFEPCVAYWDARTWPRWPNIKPQDYLAIWGYCLVDETPDIFELNLMAVIESIPAHYTKIAVICQCFTSNLGLTQNLKGIVGVYARLAIKYPKITMLLVFSDQGRDTGLEDHPEVLDEWTQLYQGITGVPTMGNGIVDGVLVDPEKYFFSLVAGQDPANYQNVMKHIVGPAMAKYGIGQQNGSNCIPRGGLYLPTSICRNAAPNPADPNEVCLGVKQDPQCWEPVGLKVYIVNDPPTQWIWNPQSDMLRYIPITTEPEPEPGEKPGVIIYSFPTTVKRNELGGLVVVFEAGSSHPLDLVEAWLDDGAPHFIMQLIPPDGSWNPGDKDLRYFRTFGWKPDRNGTFNLFMKVYDKANNVWSDVIQGQHTVTVTE